MRTGTVQLKKNQRVFTKMVSISIVYGDKVNIVNAVEGASLFDILNDAGIYLAGNCGGNGNCEACMVYIEELQKKVKACKYHVENSIHVKINNTASDVLLSNISITRNIAVELNKVYGLAVDIGTTTVAVALCDIESGTILGEKGSINDQIRYGADVAARIQYCIQQKDTKAMRKAIIDCITEVVNQLLDKYAAKISQKIDIVIAGNTTMLHILQDYPVDSLGSYPFTPYKIDGRQYNLQEIFPKVKLSTQSKVNVLPCKSAWIGADVLAGALYLSMGKRTQYELLIDLGTNGEMILCNNRGGICTSTACGPAFEGANRMQGQYGSTILKEIAMQFQKGNIDASGLICDHFFEKGIPIPTGGSLTQRVVRDIQLAKAAIATGIELMAYELRIPLEDISKVYIAGGFGFHLDIDAACTVGLLPKELRESYITVGNTSLWGAINALKNCNVSTEMSTFANSLQTMDLSLNKNFQEFFLHRINLDQ